MNSTSYPFQCKLKRVKICIVQKPTQLTISNPRVKVLGRKAHIHSSSDIIRSIPTSAFPNIKLACSTPRASFIPNIRITKKCTCPTQSVDIGKDSSNISISCNQNSFHNITECASMKAMGNGCKFSIKRVSFPSRLIHPITHRTPLHDSAFNYKLLLKSIKQIELKPIISKILLRKACKFKESIEATGKKADYFFDKTRLTPWAD